MSVAIDPAIQDDPALLDRVRQATEILEREVLGSRWMDQVKASWEREGDYPYTVKLRLEFIDELESTNLSFSPLDLASPGYMEHWMSRIWGDLLQIRSNRLISAPRASDASDRYIDGSDALDRIIDSLADYREREGHEPKALKLPIRYATALMKLGPTYWGDFYRQIRESGFRAFDGQILLGMKVELISGIDAEPQVA